MIIEILVVLKLNMKSADEILISYENRKELFMVDMEKMIDMIEKHTVKQETKIVKKKYTETDLKLLLEQAAEEIENLYGRETELTERIRDAIN